MTSRLRRFDLSISDTELREIPKEAEDFQKPQNDGDYDYGVQDAFNLSLHGDEAIHQPQQNSYDTQCDNNGNEWHLMSSNDYFSQDRGSNLLSG
jgi:hypothetical protein